MHCSECGKSQATVFLKQVAGGKVVERALCLACAQEALPDALEGTPLAGLLTALKRPPERGAAAARLRCGACGLRYAEFRQSGMLGCAECYYSFAGPLESVLRGIHGAARHAGKAPSDDAA